MRFPGLVIRTACARPPKLVTASHKLALRGHHSIDFAQASCYHPAKFLELPA